ncbi:MAG: trigger factor [Deltaproteobacteria bacterium]|nr:trigger factor [Deltaproteobacteria bacterium]
MSVVVSTEDTGPCQKQLVIEIPAPAVDAEHQRVLQEFGKEVHLPGFRKGKVPKGVVQRRFKDEIEKEVVERLLPRYWRQAEAESGLEPLLPPQVDEVELKPGEPFTFRATVEIRPEVELSGLGEFQLPDPPVEATDDEITEALDDLRRRGGDWVPVERSAAVGDLVDLEILRTSGAPPAEGEAADEEGPKEPQDLSIEVGDERVWEELSMAVTGLAEGQRSDFTKTLGEGDEAEPQKFEVRVKAVKEKELRSLDDDFAKSVGEFETLEELRQEIGKQISGGKATTRSRERETSLLDQLRERFPLDLPERVVQKDVEELVTQQAERLAQQGLDLDKADIDWAALMDQAKPQAEKRVHARLLLDAVAKDREIEVSEQEFETALSEIARAQKSSTMAVRQALDRSGRLAQLRGQLSRDKALKHLMGEDSGED